MKLTRKQFLQIASLSALGAGAGSVFCAVDPTFVPGRSAAGQGKPRWAMVVDFRKCRFGEDCDQCVAACKLAHNIPELPNRMHEVKWVWKERFENVFPSQQTDYTRQVLGDHPLPVLCNHCDEPACVRVCPTQATFKRTDGVVMMDYHRCIGCRYCMAACPYGSRSFNFEDPRPHVAHLNTDFPTRTKGVVEKCNFCEERLAKGQLPTCVEKCGQKALTFGDLNDVNSPVRRLLASRYAIQRKTELGTGPAVYYLI
jgi:molybdopterin-containing oxidoreductase family iron-sulfur binding subunit